MPKQRKKECEESSVEAKLHYSKLGGVNDLI